jgi:hypothetical protein
VVDPVSARFGCSWQDENLDHPLEDAEIVGAEAAIAWGRERSAGVWIQLGNAVDTFFAAGDEDAEDEDWDLPRWRRSRSIATGT